MRLAATLVVFCVGALLSLGLVMLYSAGMIRDPNHYVPSHYLFMQSIWGGVGLTLAALIAAFFDYRWLKKVAWPILISAAILLAIVLVEGRKINGARRWIGVGPVNFQVSEIAKLAVVIFLAYYGDRFQRHMRSFWRGLAIPGAIVGVVLGLVFVEPDRGTTILIASVTGIVLVLAGARLIFLVPPIVVGSAALAYCLWIDPVRQRRIMSWLDLESHKQGAGYQVWQSIVGIGNGGVDGLGLGNGLQKGFVPERHTDFIFSIVGEELGLIATLATIVAFLVLVLCGVSLARRARDMFGFLLASGITFLIGLQAAINIGVVTGALPNKGLPLPFVSYGGSNLLVMLTCIGILLSVARQGRVTVHELSENNPFSEVPAAQLSA